MRIAGSTFANTVGRTKKALRRHRLVARDHCRAVAQRRCDMRLHAVGMAGADQRAICVAGSNGVPTLTDRAACASAPTTSS